MAETDRSFLLATHQTAGVGTVRLVFFVLLTASRPHRALVLPKRALGPEDIDRLRALFSAFDLIMAQDALSWTRLRDLGAKVAGELDLKQDAAPLPYNEAELKDLEDEIGGRPVLHHVMEIYARQGDLSTYLNVYRRAGGDLTCAIPAILLLFKTDYTSSLV